MSKRRAARTAKRPGTPEEQTTAATVKRTRKRKVTGHPGTSEEAPEKQQPQQSREKPRRKAKEPKPVPEPEQAEFVKVRQAIDYGVPPEEASLDWLNGLLMHKFQNEPTQQRQENQENEGRGVSKKSVHLKSWRGLVHCLTGSASEKNKTRILAFKCCGKLFRTGPSAVSHIQYHHAQKTLKWKRWTMDTRISPTTTSQTEVVATSEKC